MQYKKYEAPQHQSEMVTYHQQKYEPPQYQSEIACYQLLRYNSPMSTKLAEHQMMEAEAVPMQYK